MLVVGRALCSRSTTNTLARHFSGRRMQDAQTEEEEMFEIFSEDNKQSLGLERRSVVHKTGLFHRSVHVLIHNKKGDVLLQQRSSTKDVCPGLWDLSCGEHLKPQESYQDGAARGIAEELSIHLPASSLVQVRPAAIQKVHIPEKQIIDNEYTEFFEATIDDPSVVQIDPVEVQAIRWLPLIDLPDLLASDPASFTPWGLSDLLYYTRRATN